MIFKPVSIIESNHCQGLYIKDDLLIVSDLEETSNNRKIKYTPDLSNSVKRVELTLKNVSDENSNDKDIG